MNEVRNISSYDNGKEDAIEEIKEDDTIINEILIETPRGYNQVYSGSCQVETSGGNSKTATIQMSNYTAHYAKLVPYANMLVVPTGCSYNHTYDSSGGTSLSVNSVTYEAETGKLSIKFKVGSTSMSGNMTMSYKIYVADYIPLL